MNSCIMEYRLSQRGAQREAHSRLGDDCAPADGDGAFLSLIDRAEVKNRILAALPKAEFELLSKAMSPVDLELGETLHRHGDVIEHV